MGYNARVIADSVTPEDVRLTTMEVTFPRIVLAEFNTHRMFSRNSASSRAIPVEKMLQRVETEPFIPVYWGKNQKGMQANEELSPEQARQAELEWLLARDHAVTRAKEMLALGIHKQITNRLLEPWLMHTVIVSSTEWENYFGLRTHADAQPEIRKAALLMQEAYHFSKPKHVAPDSWHLPLVSDQEQLVNDGFTIEDIRMISVGRCARVSYLTHDGQRNPRADIDLALRLMKSGHMSPFEHVARPMTQYEQVVYRRLEIRQHGTKLKSHERVVQKRNDGIFLVDVGAWAGNYRGWVQERKTLAYEDNFMQAQIFAEAT